MEYTRAWSSVTNAYHALKSCRMDDPGYTHLRASSVDVDALHHQLQKEQARAQELLAQTEVQARTIDQL
eukprot:441182-Karenia_brevis.AAC.1